MRGQAKWVRRTTLPRIMRDHNQPIARIRGGEAGMIELMVKKALRTAPIEKKDRKTDLIRYWI